MPRSEDLPLSFICVVAASAGYALTGIERLDSLGAVAIAVFAFREGREAYGKARGKTDTSGGMQGQGRVRKPADLQHDRTAGKRV